ncbi:MAG: DNA alkylation repair protein [bacterium]
MKKATSLNKPADDCAAIIAGMRAMENPVNIAGMARFGINVKNACGVSMPWLRAKAKEIGKNHRLALDLWNSGIHEAKILAALVDVPAAVTEKQMERWVKDFNSWDICDQVCGNLFDKTPFAYKKVIDWTAREEEYVKRAGYVLIAALAVHDKKAGDEAFVSFLPIIEAGAGDDRNFVKKAVNWALRQIGKRNMALNARAVATGEKIRASGGKSARWIAADALRELTDINTLHRIKAKKQPD